MLEQRKTEEWLVQNVECKVMSSSPSAIEFLALVLTMHILSWCANIIVMCGRLQLTIVPSLQNYSPFIFIFAMLLGQTIPQ